MQVSQSLTKVKLSFLAKVPGFRHHFPLLRRENSKLIKLLYLNLDIYECLFESLIYGIRR